MSTFTTRRSKAATATLGIVSMLAGLVLLATPATAQDDTASVPTEAGETVTVEWSGTVPPDSNDSSDCTEATASDSHEIEITVPPGTYDDVQVRLSATVTPTGPTASGSDVIVTVVRPDGSATSGDSGFVGAAETTGFVNPSQGVYTVLACAFLSANPQPYDGVLTLEAHEIVPETVVEPPCTLPATTPKFTETYIDETRAGGEPMIITHPDSGELLWGSHAGTTHFYSPAAPSPTTGAFVENYEGQTYYYFSPDGKKWEFVPRQGPSDSEVSPVAGIPASGFSDPEFAVDQAGNVFISEINLANVAVSKSSDGGHTYGLQNLFSFTMSDRQWMAADREDELYMAANGFGGGAFGPTSGSIGNTQHFIAKSVDGGVTWFEPLVIDPIVGDIDIDQDRGLLYSLYEQSGTLSMAVFPNIRNEETDFTVELHEIASGLALTGVQRLIDPTFDLDDEGNLYVTWPDNGQGMRPAGVYYAYSTDQGETWSLPHRVDPDANADVWPWITVGDVGDVTVTWLQGNEAIEGELPGEEGGEDVKWSVAVATSDTGLGCAESGTAGFTVSQASQEHVHTGTICQHGTVCQTDLTDRRLGDYFSATTSHDGLINIAVSDTRQGGATALPLHIRQLSADELASAAEPPEDTTGGAPADDVEDTPTTGGGLAVLGLGSLLTAFAWHRRRDD